MEFLSTHVRPWIPAESQGASDDGLRGFLVIYFLGDFVWAYALRGGELPPDRRTPKLPGYQEESALEMCYEWREMGAVPSVPSYSVRGCGGFG